MKYPCPRPFHLQPSQVMQTCRLYTYSQHNFFQYATEQCPTGAHLVHNVLLVYRLQYLCLDDGMEVGVHELKDQVDVLVVACLDHVQQLNDILMGGEGLVYV